MLERLQKIIARAGVASRREAETLITDGKVTVNGELVTELGAKADPAKDHIKVNGKLIQADEARQYILLYKPKGVVSTVHDPEGRPTVTDLIKDVPARIYPVGRLDFNTEGVLLLTNDGDLTNKLLAPKSKCPKTYTVKVHGKPEQKTLMRLQRGMTIDGNRYGSCKIEMLKGGQNSWLRVVLFEGKNHQIKKMFETVGHPVSKLRRIAFAFLTSKGLRPGEWRYLNPVEVDRLERGDYEFLTPLNPFKFLREVGVGLRLADYEAYREAHGGPPQTRTKDPKRAQYVRKMKDRQQQDGRFDRERSGNRDGRRPAYGSDEGPRRDGRADNRNRPRDTRSWRDEERRERPRRDGDRNERSRGDYRRDDSRGRSGGYRDQQRADYRDRSGYRGEERRGRSERPPRDREGYSDRRPREQRDDHGYRDRSSYRSDTRRPREDRGGPPRSRGGERDRRPRRDHDEPKRPRRDHDEPRRPRRDQDEREYRGSYRSESRRPRDDRDGPGRGRGGEREWRPRRDRDHREYRGGPQRGRDGERDRRPRPDREEGGYRGGYRGEDRRERSDGERRFSSRRDHAPRRGSNDSRGERDRRPERDRSSERGRSEGDRGRSGKPARFKAKRPQKAWAKSFDRSGKKGGSKK